MAAEFSNNISFCYADYSLFGEEKSKFDVQWSPYNSSYTPASADDRIYSAFQYRNSSDLNGFMYAGRYASYSGGGYVYEMRGSYSQIVGNVSRLQALDWIDRRTRAVFVEFTSYNPNIDLFMYSTILFEILPTGNVVKSFEFIPINLFADIRESVIVFKIGFFVVYLAFIIFFMVKEIRLMVKLKKVRGNSNLIIII